MKTKINLDTVSNVLIVAGLFGVLYKTFTGKLPEKTINKLITTYNTGRMWKSLFPFA